MAHPNEILATNPADHADATAMRWVLKYGDRVYGPYSFDAMAAYAAEGRVAPHSLVAPEGTPAGAGTWRAAGDLPQFAVLFGGSPHRKSQPRLKPKSKPIPPRGRIPPSRQMSKRRSRTTLPRTSECNPNPPHSPLSKRSPWQPRRSPSNNAASPTASGKGQVDRRKQPETANFLIVLDIKARFAGPLEQAIMSLGPAYKLATNVWCVNTDATAPGLLNDLSVHIGKTDTMFIADTTRDRTAWSSMGPEVDAKIRRVWRRTY